MAKKSGNLRDVIITVVFAAIVAAGKKLVDTVGDHLKNRLRHPPKNR